ncbi:DUF6519 domain-containing protein [Sphingomonas sp.]|uniref:DUF6519 domain-containing protein n=1 Tax=Sphingomonas sp. TaxID=28214 RepID=UPI001B2A3D5A|nr:DUF6519 domain-containing protein [Sphingomonas sp.]MBO9713896.1 OmpA family protein [Sphingomonas sp.]
MTIRNDATRQRIPVTEARPLRGVVARQGQVLLDTDVNEAERTLIDRVETADASMLGPPDRLLYPAGTTGFNATGTPANCTIGPGTGYLKGWQLVNPSAVTLANQPNPWNGSAPPAPALVVLKALVRHIDPAEDSALADVALGDAQASGRALNDWQAFLFPVPSGTTCAQVTGLADYQLLVGPSTGTLAFQLSAPAASSDPCSLTPAGGHSRFENLLYRIEVHGGTVDPNRPTADGPRFKLAGLKLKLSRRNASLMAQVTQVNGNEITVSPPALDPRAWFSQGAYAEIVGPGDDIDPTKALAKERLLKIALATDEVITLTGDVAGTGLQAGIQAGGKWFLRLWDAWPDGSGVATVPGGGGTIDLGDGIAIKVAGGASAIFRRGDYWTAAVRADGSIAWPGIATPNPTQQAPHGPEIRYAPLAILGAAGIEDCRIPFATLSDRALLYRGGDGQEAFAPEASAPTPIALPLKLRVAVMRGATPVPGAQIAWRTSGGGAGSWINGTDISGGPVVTATNPDGLAEVTWSINAQQQAVAHRVEAVLLDNGQAANTPPIVFGAQFQTAARTSFRPGDCETLSDVTDVQAALDALCEALDEREPDTIRLKQITLASDAGKETELIDRDLILNALEVDSTAFTSEIRFDLNVPSKLGLGVEPDDPVAEISLDLPYPTTDPERSWWLRMINPPAAGAQVQQMGNFGYQTTRLDGTIAVDDNTLIWTPSNFARRFLNTAIFHRFGSEVRDPDLKPFWTGPELKRVLCRIRLRSALIFVDDPKTKKRIWLNAEHLGTREKVTGRELMLGERDPQRAADLDMFLYLRVAEPGIVFYFPRGSSTANRSNLGTVEDGMKAALAHWQAQPTGVKLTSNTDETATKPQLLTLSQQRADKIRTALTGKGVNAGAITIESNADTKQPFQATPDADDSLNRRVAVTFEGNFKP